MESSVHGCECVCPLIPLSALFRFSFRWSWCFYSSRSAVLWECVGKFFLESRGSIFAALSIQPERFPRCACCLAPPALRALLRLIQLHASHPCRPPYRIRSRLQAGFPRGGGSTREGIGPVLRARAAKDPEGWRRGRSKRRPKSSKFPSSRIWIGPIQNGSWTWSELVLPEPR